MGKEPFVIAAGFLALVAAVAALVGCEHGSNILIDPPPGCEDVYDRAFQDGVDSVECEEGDDWTDICDEDVPRGHLRKECRGKPTAQEDPIGCDPDLGPCPIELAGTVCRTECWDDLLGRVCETICSETSV